MNQTEAIAYLTRDGGDVPCSRYGRNSEQCAPVAYAVAVIVLGETNGSEPDEMDLDYYMGLVVNDSDDVEHIIRDMGEQYGFKAADLLD